jgi:hypothetical protein
MPIKPENRGRYPKNWKEIREQVLERAAHACEECRVKNYAVIQRGCGHDKGTFREPDTGTVRDAPNGWWRGYAHESDYCGTPVRIILTIAHLDHTPENCDLSNLKALCQLHHLRYDAAHHAESARQTRRARKAIADLFDSAIQS